MAKKKNFLFSDQPLDAFEEYSEPETKDVLSSVSQSILRIFRVLEETDAYVTTSRKYVDASKSTMDSLKKLVTHAEVDLNTAEECIIETERRMSALQKEIQSLFSVIFFQDLDDNSKDTSQKINYGSENEPIKQLENSYNRKVTKTSKKCADKIKIKVKNSKKSEQSKNETIRNQTFCHSSLSLDNLAFENVNNTSKENPARSAHSLSFDNFKNFRKDIRHSLPKICKKQNHSIQMESPKIMFSQTLMEQKEGCPENTLENYGNQPSPTSAIHSSTQKCSPKHESTSKDDFADFLDSLSCNQRAGLQNVRQQVIKGPSSREVGSSRYEYGLREKKFHKIAESSSQEHLIEILSTDSASSDIELTHQIAAKQKKSSTYEPLTKNNQNKDKTLINSSDDFVPLLKIIDDMKSDSSSDSFEVMRNTFNEIGISVPSEHSSSINLIPTSSEFIEVEKTFSDCNLQRTHLNKKASDFQNARSEQLSKDFRIETPEELTWGFGQLFTKIKPKEETMQTQEKDFDVYTSDSQFLRNSSVRRKNVHSKKGECLSSSFGSSGTLDVISCNSSVFDAISDSNKSKFLDANVYRSGKKSVPEYKNILETANKDHHTSFGSLINAEYANAETNRDIPEQIKIKDSKLSEYFRGISIEKPVNRKKNSKHAFSHAYNEDFCEIDETDSSKNSSESPSYVSFTDEVIYPKHNLPWFENISDSDFLSNNGANELSLNEAKMDYPVRKIRNNIASKTRKSVASKSALNGSYHSQRIRAGIDMQEIPSVSLCNKFLDMFVENSNPNSLLHCEESAESFVTVYEGSTRSIRHSRDNLTRDNSTEQFTENISLSTSSEESDNNNQNSSAVSKSGS